MMKFDAIAKIGTEILLVDFSDEFKARSSRPTFKATSLQGHLGWQELLDPSGLFIRFDKTPHNNIVQVRIGNVISRLVSQFYTRKSYNSRQRRIMRCGAATTKRMHLLSVMWLYKGKFIS